MGRAIWAEKEPGKIKTPTGKPFSSLSYDKVISGELTADDMRGVHLNQGRLGEELQVAQRGQVLLMNDRGALGLENGDAPKGVAPDEVVIGLAPAFGVYQHETIIHQPHDKVLREIFTPEYTWKCSSKMEAVCR